MKRVTTRGIPQFSNPFLSSVLVIANAEQVDWIELKLKLETTV